MSRVGRLPITVPSSVKVTQQGATWKVEGPKGKLSLTLPGALSASVKEGSMVLERRDDEKRSKALHGLYRALAANAIKGAADGFSKELEVSGVGYRAQAKGKQVELTVGFSHPVVIDVPEGLTVETPKLTIIVIKGADKQQVGQLAATIRRVAPPEPYKGKGIKYAGEVIRRKAGKAATGAKGAGGAAG